MFCITYNADGTEAYREQISKKTGPIKCGFVKRSDGNYHKKLGDPRCITDEIKKQELIQEKFNQFTENTEAIMITKYSVGLLNTLVFKATTKLAESDFHNFLQTYKISSSDSELVLEDVQLSPHYVYHGIDQRTQYAQILINRRYGYIELRNNDAKKAEPDLLILEAL